MKISSLCLLLLAVLVDARGSFAGACGTDGAVYASSNRPLIFRTNADAERLTPKDERLQTDKLHHYIDERVLAFLQTNGAQLQESATYVQCLQADVPEYQTWKDETNTPISWSVSGANPTVALAFWMYRGRSRGAKC
jgi:hypothetical protein